MNLVNLNEKQLEAINAIDGKIKVVAGAGSGKTSVLAARYAYLIDEIGIDSENILCMTFTNKAASEMKWRIAKYMNRPASINDLICTIHGFCVKVLRRDIYRLGWPENFIIADEEDLKVFSKQIIEEIGLDKKIFTTRHIWTQIEAYKGQYYSNNYVQRLIPNSENEDLDTITKLWFDLQTKNFTLDFHDLIYFTLSLFNQFPEVLKYWQDLIEYVQVDEVQDCNRNDWEIISQVSKRSGNLFVVGDPDQAIYEWRGSKPELFTKFNADQTIILNDNYRSTPNILECANSVIKNNTDRIEKDLKATKEFSSKPIYFHGANEKQESEFVAESIKRIVENIPNTKYSDFAILYRANYISRSFEQALIKHKVPYVVWGGIRFFERKEIKDSLAYLQLINQDNDLAFSRIINVPSRKFGKTKIDELSLLAKQENTSLYQTLKNHIQDKLFNREQFKDFIKLIEKYRNINKENKMSISDILYFINKESGLFDIFRLDEDCDRIENVNELISSIKLYEEDNKEEEDLSLTKYLQDIALYTNLDCSKETEKVKLMTVHQVKGLEFPYVYVVGLNEGIFPSHKSIRERKKKGEEEERRLMYVAITRAENQLILTDSEGYTYNNGGGYKLPSRFLFEIKEDLIEYKGEQIEYYIKHKLQEMIESLNNEVYSDEEQCKYYENCQVTHKVFGNGIIVNTNKDKNTCEVKFENGKNKNLRFDVLQLKNSPLDIY